MPIVAPLTTGGRITHEPGVRTSAHTRRHIVLSLAQHRALSLAAVAAAYFVTARLGLLLAGEAHSGALEKRYLHRDGHVIWTHYSATLLRDEAGRPLYFIFHVQDVTARKQAEQALRESEARLRTVITHAPDDIQRAYELGAITYLTKPRTLPEMMNLARNLLDFWARFPLLPTTLPA